MKRICFLLLVLFSERLCAQKWQLGYRYDFNVISYAEFIPENTRFYLSDVGNTMLSISEGYMLTLDGNGAEVSFGGPTVRYTDYSNYFAESSVVFEQNYKTYSIYGLPSWVSFNYKHLKTELGVGKRFESRSFVPFVSAGVKHFFNFDFERLTLTGINQGVDLNTLSNSQKAAYAFFYNRLVNIRQNQFFPYLKLGVDFYSFRVDAAFMTNLGNYGYSEERTYKRSYRGTVGVSYNFLRW